MKVSRTTLPSATETLTPDDIRDFVFAQFDQRDTLIWSVLVRVMGETSALIWSKSTIDNRGSVCRFGKDRGDGTGSIGRYFASAVVSAFIKYSSGAENPLFVLGECLDEILSECLLESAELYDATKGSSYPTWLYGRLLFKGANWLKKYKRNSDRTKSMDIHADRDGSGADQARSRFLADHGINVDSGNPIDSIVHAETVSGMVRAMGEEDRKIAEMLADGLPQTIVAERLGMKATTLNMRIGRIREKIAAAR